MPEEENFKSDVPKLIEFLIKHNFPVTAEISDGGREIALKLVVDSPTKLVLAADGSWKVV
jgi:hypothetical protein